MRLATVMNEGNESWLTMLDAATELELERTVSSRIRWSSANGASMSVRCHRGKLRGALDLDYRFATVGVQRDD